MSVDNRRMTVGGMAVLALLMGLTLGLSFVVPSFVGVETGLLLEALGTLWSGVLTLALIWIYDSLRSVEETQVEIQGRQTRIMRGSPLVQVGAWRVSGHDIEINLANIGDGPALDLRMGIAVYPCNLDAETDFDVVPVSLTQNSNSSQFDFLQPGESRQFGAYAVASSSVLEEENESFHAVIDKIVGMGEDTIEILVFIEYSDTEGERKEMGLFSSKIYIPANYSFERLVSAGELTDRVEDPTPPDNYHDIYW